MSTDGDDTVGISVKFGDCKCISDVLQRERERTKNFINIATELFPQSSTQDRNQRTSFIQQNFVSKKVDNFRLPNNTECQQFLTYKQRITHTPKTGMNSF